MEVSRRLKNMMCYLLEKEARRRVNHPDFAEEDKACPPLQQGGQDFSPLTLETSMAEINFAETGLCNGGVRDTQGGIGSN